MLFVYQAGCRPDWVTYTDSLAPGGEPQPGILTSQACEASCLRNPQCEGISLRLPGEDFCSHHFDANVLPFLEPDAGVRFQYLQFDCQGKL